MAKCVYVCPKMNSIWHAFFPMSLLGSVKRGVDGPLSESSTCSSKQELWRDEQFASNNARQPQAFFMQSAGNAAKGARHVSHYRFHHALHT